MNARMLLLATRSLLVSTALLCGCPPPAPIPVDAPLPDAPVPPRPDAGPITCVDDDECDDTQFCNGTERCRPGAAGTDARGCLPARGGGCLAGQTCFEVGDRCVTECEVSEDADGDGANAVECGGLDCDDADPNRYPGNAEVCDALAHDEDCDTSTFGGLDMDRDGALDARCCNVESDTLICGTDCADYAASVRPGAPEDCDGRDQNCNGMIDEGVTTAGYADDDRDQHGDPLRPVTACTALAGFSLLSDDCDDTRIEVHGAQPEICDGRDNDCDGDVDEEAQPVTWYRDADGDGYGSALSGTTVSCAPVPGSSVLGTDCDDTRRGRSPLARESCNGLDDDCDGIATFPVGGGDTEDDDGDGVPDLRCPRVGADCDDRDPATYPGATELCDERDNDCDGMIEAALIPADWYLDRDGDGWGDGDSAVIVSCALEPGRVTRDGDCDDRDAVVSPSAVDACGGIGDGRDDDCDARIDEGGGLTATYLDGDDDGFGAGTAALACTVAPSRSIEGGDCDDDDPLRRPGGSESCALLDGLDDDCDGLTDCEDADCTGAVGCGGAVRIELVSGGAQTVVALATTPVPIAARILDATSGVPVPDARVVLRLAPGLGASPTELRTDGAGVARTFVRAGLSVGAQDVTFVAPGAASVTTTVMVTAPTPGLIATLLNAGRVPATSPSLSGAATSTVPGAIGGLAAGPSGELFVSDPARHCIYRIDPAGALTVFAGVCGARGYAGDGDLALEARFDTPSALAISRGRLVVADSENRRIRVIDLITRETDTLAGGGLVTGPEVDSALARLTPTELAIDADQSVLAIDRRNPVRVVRVDEVRGVTVELLRESNAGITLDSMFGAGAPYVVGTSSTGQALYGLSTVAGITAAARIDHVALPGSSVDREGNLLALQPYINTDQQLVRIAAFTRSAEILAGGGSERADHVAGTASTLFGGSMTASFGDHVVVASGNRLQMVFSLPRPAPEFTLTAEGTLPATRLVASIETLRTRVTAAGGVSPAVTLEYEARQLGAVLTRFSGRADGTGRADSEVQVGPVPGRYRFLVHLRDFSGREVEGSPVTFDLDALAPPPGALSLYVGPFTTGGFGDYGVARGEPALLLAANFGAFIGDEGMAIAPDGTLYFGRSGLRRITAVRTDGDSRTAAEVTVPFFRSVAVAPARSSVLVATVLRVEEISLTTGEARIIRPQGTLAAAVRPDGTFVLGSGAGVPVIDFLAPDTLVSRSVPLTPMVSCTAPLEIARLGRIAVDPRNGDVYMAAHGCTGGGTAGTFILALRAADDSVEVIVGNPDGSGTSTDPRMLLLGGVDELRLAVAADGTLAFTLTYDTFTWSSRVMTLAPGGTTVEPVAGGGATPFNHGVVALEAALSVAELGYFPDGRLALGLHELGQRDSVLGGYDRGGVVVLW